MSTPYVPYPGQPAPGYAPQPMTYPAPLAAPARPPMNPIAFVVAGAGLLALIMTFLPTYKMAISCVSSGSAQLPLPIDACSLLNQAMSSVLSGVSLQFNAWQGGTPALVICGGGLLLLLAGVVALGGALSGMRQKALSGAALGLSALGLGLVVVGLFVNPVSTLPDMSALTAGAGFTIGIDFTREIGYWLCLGLAVVTVAAAAILFLTDSKAPAPQAVGYSPTPAPGYAPGAPAPTAYPAPAYPSQPYPMAPQAWLPAPAQTPPTAMAPAPGYAQPAPPWPQS